MAILATVVLVILAIVGWCAWRFCKKKRPKGADKGGKGDDENALVDNEEAQAEEVVKHVKQILLIPPHTSCDFAIFQVEEKQESESCGRIKFRIEYDFTLQELKVTVRNFFLNI